ncbi:hyphally regulated cell wall protein 1-like [Spinacia oleracea]|uniref:Hyphally regulated cell wall protein 1-like n=1 Tax=Spinacia oleracea TaxID=3562 RepID=A0ABM3RP77_SPIOL|nr:hyphally regulated cell wall protein 1-like [Spinacia oleracea]
MERGTKSLQELEWDGSFNNHKQRRHELLEEIETGEGCETGEARRGARERKEGGREVAAGWAARQGCAGGSARQGREGDGGWGRRKNWKKRGECEGEDGGAGVAVVDVRGGWRSSVIEGGSESGWGWWLWHGGAARGRKKEAGEGSRDATEEGARGSTVVVE